MFDFLVIGAGISGLTFARIVREAGKTVLVVDRRNNIGGNMHCSDVGGIEVHDYGPHIFHTSNETAWRFANRFTEFEPYFHSVMAIKGDGIYNLPFNMNLFHSLFGVKTPEEAMKAIDEDKVKNDSPKNAEEQALSLVGKKIYEGFIKGYTEKQWGKPCTELPVDIMRRIPLRFDFNNSYFRDKWTGIPKQGYNKFIQNILGDIPVMLGIDFIKNREIQELADKVYYTGPLDELYGRHCGVLEYRSLRFEHEILDVDNYQGASVVNYVDGEVPYTRITEHKHFKKTVNDYSMHHTVISREYPQNYNSGLNGEEPYYPINDKRNDELYSRYHKLAEEDGIIVGGRLGDYKYYSMDEAIQAAMITARKELWRS